jgi:hypothetical protein
MRLNNVEVPNGPYVAIEKTSPPANFKSVDLGQSWPISSDEHGNLILFINKDVPPADFPTIHRTGQYLRAAGGHYQDIGDDPAQLTVDGKLVQVTPKNMPKSWTVKVNGEEIKPCPIDQAVTDDGTHAMFAASNHIFVNIRYGDLGSVTGFTEAGQPVPIQREIRRSESFAVSLLRTVGVFESGRAFTDNHAMQATASGTVFTQTWANHGLYEDWYNSSGRLSVLSGDHFEFVSELKNTAINTEMAVTPSGKVGLNLIGNCSFLTRPAIYNHGKVTLLPIPEGSISAELLGLADDGSAVLLARHDTALLFYQNGKLYPMTDLLAKSYHGNLAPISAYRAIPKLMPQDLHGLRVKNPMLHDGSILCETADENPRLILLEKSLVIS